jgi:redox-sensitive bicupin YhaK (pirin superfamily)
MIKRLIMRAVSQLIKGHYTMDGAGVKLYRVFGGVPAAYATDPFLLLDFFGSDNPSDYIQGFPWHPHRGIETVTYLLEGKVEHEDSEGNRGVIYPGDAQWMTAGSGIFHQEMPKPLSQNDRGILQSRIITKGSIGLQLWINLPADKKMTKPVYRDVKSNHVPTVKVDGGEVKVVAGEFAGAKGPVVTGEGVDPSYLDVSLKPNSEFAHKVKENYTVLAYVLKGKAKFDRNTEASEGSLIIYGNGNEINVSSYDGSRFIILSGRPIREPIAWYGPIVMNNQQQINEALIDLRKGTFIRDKAPLFE